MEETEAAFAAEVAKAACQDDHTKVIISVAEPPDAPTFAAFLGDSQLSDVTLCCDDGRSFHVHKVLLMRWSKPLECMLTGGMREGHEATITLRGVDSAVLHACLRFMYCHKCAVDIEQLVPLLALADLYDVALLQRLCLEAVQLQCSKWKVACKLYHSAKKTGLMQVLQVCTDALVDHLPWLARSHQDFAQLDMEDVSILLCTRLTSDSNDGGGGGGGGGDGGRCSAPRVPMRVMLPEFKVFEVLMAWAACAPAAGGEDGGGGKAEEHRWRQLDVLLDLVQFGAMSVQELCKVRRHPDAARCTGLHDRLLDAYEALAATANRARPPWAAGRAAPAAGDGPQPQQQQQQQQQGGMPPGPWDRVNPLQPPQPPQLLQRQPPQQQQPLPPQPQPPPQQQPPALQLPQQPPEQPPQQPPVRQQDLPPLPVGEDLLPLPMLDDVPPLVDEEEEEEEEAAVKPRAMQPTHQQRDHHLDWLRQAQHLQVAGRAQGPLRLIQHRRVEQQQAHEPALLQQPQLQQQVQELGLQQQLRLLQQRQQRLH